MKNENIKTHKSTRYPLLDWIRGFAVVLMVIFHFSYDLNKFGFIRVDFIRDLFWFRFPRVIVFLFMICVGIGLSLNHKKQINWPNFWKRFRKLAGFALAVSVFTFYAFPKNYVFFGTLHSIAICSLLGLGFLKRPKLSLVLGLLMCGTNLIMQKDFIKWNKILEIQSMDYIPIYPWLGVVLLGIYLESIDFHKKSLPNWVPAQKFFEWLGAHSLKIYLLHQIILFVLVYLAFTIIQLF
jgi:uncharacterized membrane protein